MGRIHKTTFEIELDRITDEAIAHREVCEAGKGTCGKSYVCDTMAMYNLQMLGAFHEQKRNAEK